ncbi:hypothetical protein ACOME3_004741 [Neoechinorhynchus agilis]
MKFAKYLATHKAPEWRSEYIRYDEMKEILYSAQANALSNGFITSDSTSEFYENIDQEFLDQCKRELEKINQFYATKIEESKNRLNVLKQQIDLTFGDENFDFEKSKKQNFEKLLPSEDSPVGVLSNIRSTKIAAHQFWERKRNLLRPRIAQFNVVEID